MGIWCSLFCLSEQEMSAYAGLLTRKRIHFFIQDVAMKIQVNPSQAYVSPWSQGAVQRQVHHVILPCLVTALLITEPSPINSFTNQISDQGSARTGLTGVGFEPLPADVLLLARIYMSVCVGRAGSFGVLGQIPNCEANGILMLPRQHSRQLKLRLAVDSCFSPLQNHARWALLYGAWADWLCQAVNLPVFASSNHKFLWQ